jgi:DNA-binding transcriptional MerR regulator/methylmalonyl-CoA mutase cobalamin-binding subunit
MYTIKQASLRTGVSVELIRAWERRYGVVTPERSAGGYRLYDEQAVSRLRTMRRLIADGWSAAQAASQVIAVPPSSRPMSDRAAPATPDEGDLVAAAARYDPVAIERVLDDLFGRGTFESVIDDLVLPAAAGLGEAWADGRLDVAAEHLASGSLARRLSALLDQGGAPGRGPQVLVGLPPGSRHELGALAFAVAMRRLGADVLYLGADVPADSWVDAVDQSSARAAVIAVVTEADVTPAILVAEAVRAAQPGLVIAVGGAAGGQVASSDALVLPGRIVEAARVLESELSPLN